MYSGGRQEAECREGLRWSSEGLGILSQVGEKPGSLV